VSPVHEGTPVTWQVLIGVAMKNEERQRVRVDTGTSPNLPIGVAFGLLHLSAVIVVSSLVQLACQLSLLFEVVRTRMKERNNWTILLPLIRFYTPSILEKIDYYMCSFSASGECS
jgi:hypothetical protein